MWLQSPTRSETPRLLCGAAAPGAIARTGRASDLDMRCSALPSLSAVVVLSLTFPRQSPRESPSRHLALLCVFRTHRMCAPNGVFKRRTTDRMRARERASSRRSHCFSDVELCLTISAHFPRVYCRYDRSELQRDVRRPPLPPHHARARSRRERERERERELELELEPTPTPTTTPTPSSPASKLTSPVLMSAFWAAGCAPTKTGPRPV